MCRRYLSRDNDRGNSSLPRLVGKPPRPPLRSRQRPTRRLRRTFQDVSSSPAATPPINSARPMRLSSRRRRCASLHSDRVRHIHCRVRPSRAASKRAALTPRWPRSKECAARILASCRCVKMCGALSRRGSGSPKKLQNAHHADLLRRRRCGCPARRSCRRRKESWCCSKRSAGA